MRTGSETSGTKTHHIRIIGVPEEEKEKVSMT